MLVGTSLDFQYADSEFFGLEGEPRGERAFPLRGEYYGASLNLAIRAGFTDDLELELLVPFRLVSYASDPVLLLPQPAGSPLSSIDYYQENVIQLAQTTAGLADVQVAARYRWLRSPLQLTTELRLATPGGYDGPAGTFGERPESAQDFAENVTTYVRPENVTDDVTLGDGVVELTLRQQLGVSFSSGTFVAGDVGYALRFGGAGDQLVASLRAGQLIEGVVMLFAGASMALSVEEGRIIGVSVAAEDPTLPAEDYGGTTNLLLREVRLQRDWLNVYGGVIVRLSPEVELKAAYARTVWGRNVAAVNTVTIGIAARAHLIDPPAPEPTPAEEPVDQAAVDAEPVAERPASGDPVDGPRRPAPGAPGPRPNGPPADAPLGEEATPEPHAGDDRTR
ncbi:MAG TPA: hypothetical protein RMH99_03475 [Sandaracinaceae bacterium LLY-WYZ-13_1]|nr:hypothetical protein [Sandaracinaceae bacterium LLY-WYZ-13_1]